MKWKIVVWAIVLVLFPFIVNILAYVRYLFGSKEQRQYMRDHDEV